MKILAISLLTFISTNYSIAADVELGKTKVIERPYVFDLDECEQNWTAKSCHISLTLNSNDMKNYEFNSNTFEFTQDIVNSNGVTQTHVAKIRFDVKNSQFYARAYKFLNGSTGIQENLDFSDAKPFFKELLKSHANNEIKVKILTY